MPPKRNSKAKTNKLIKTRLLRISFKLDDYVYKNKPISAEEAQMYIDEVALFKSQCGQDDEHSLQVIEKLTHCMKAIINEQREEHGYGVTNLGEGTQTYCPSPIYSLPDEDKIMFNGNYNINEDIIANINDLDTIDLTDDQNNYVNTCIIPVNTDVEVHRAIHSMSLRDVEDPLSINIRDCSQSILDNFKHNTINVFENIGHIAPVQNSLDVNKELGNYRLQSVKQSILRNIRKCNIPINKALETQPVKKVKETELYATHLDSGTIDGRTIKINDENKVIKRKSIITKMKCCTQDETITVVKLDKKTRRKKNVDNTQNKPVKQKKKYNARKNKKHIAESVQVKTSVVTKETDHTLKPTYHNINANYSNATEKDLGNNLKPIKVDILQTPNKLIPPVYNKNTESDFSWVENVRFVRKVAGDEYDLTLTDIGNEFWDNFTLPNNWNDQDFDF